ncbi:MAG: DUF5063 domain-containing protein [Candidatus Amulumruptor caecigallinarius]|nr:DUF5063 domain-containing protein [Candidatus Amulumruptor caecigallinarius]
MANDITQSQLLGITALASNYCVCLENATEGDKSDFIVEILSLLPRIYWEFSELEPDEKTGFDEFQYFNSYVDEEYYDSIRRKVEMVMGPDDVFLETFENDMKYSDTPIAASISESLADIFQPLYNFISVVKESDGTQTLEAYRECRESFIEYWSQTLCNVLRALNHLRFNQTTSL